MNSVTRIDYKELMDRSRWDNAWLTVFNGGYPKDRIHFTDRYDIMDLEIELCDKMYNHEGLLTIEIQGRVYIWTEKQWRDVYDVLNGWLSSYIMSDEGQKAEGLV